jgi:hypothetical protein
LNFHPSETLERRPVTVSVFWIASMPPVAHEWMLAEKFHRNRRQFCHHVRHNHANFLWTTAHRGA